MPVYFKTQSKIDKSQTETWGLIFQSFYLFSSASYVDIDLQPKEFYTKTKLL